MLISKIVRIAGYCLLFFVVLFITLGILFNVYFSKKMIEILEDQVSKSTNNEYVLSLDKITVNLFTQVVTIHNIVVVPSNTHLYSKAQYVFKAKILKIIDFSLISYFRDRDLLIDRVEFEEPEISILRGPERLSKNISTENKISLYAAFSKKLNSISIHNIDIVNSKFNIYRNGYDLKPIFSSNDNSVSIKNFKINVETDKKNRLFFAEKFEVVMNKFSYHLKDGLYTLTVKKLYASYVDSTLIVDSLQLVPNFNKKEFASEAGQQTSRANIKSSKIVCENMDVKQFFEYSSLVIRKVNIDGCSIDVFRDNRLPLAPIMRPSIQAMIKKLPFFMSVDSIEMKNGIVTFEVINPGAASTGKVFVKRMDVVITGIENDTSLYISDQSMKATVNGYLLDQGKFSQTYTFPLKATAESFSCSGGISSMSMVPFNSIIEQAKHVSIKSGQIDTATFSFVAYENSSTGTMKFKYHDLKIEVLNAATNSNGLKEKLKTFIANKVIINESNPGKDGIVRITKLYTKHNPYRYFLNYSMQTILSGIEPSLGNQKMIKMMSKKK